MCQRHYLCNIILKGFISYHAGKCLPQGGSKLAECSRVRDGAFLLNFDEPYAANESNPKTWFSMPCRFR